MSQFPTNKTVPLDKDIGVSTAKSQSIGTGAREQLSVVLDAIDLKIKTNADSSSTAVANEASARQNADNALQLSINNEITNRQNADTAEATARANADTAEASARSSADTILQNEIDGERSPLRVTEVSSSASISINPANAQRVRSDGSNGVSLGLASGVFQSDFPGATVNFATGAVSYTGGSPASSTFSLAPTSGQANKWTKYSVVLLPTAPDTLLITWGGTYATTAAAVASPVVTGGIPIAVVAVQINATANGYQNFTSSNITQFAASGSGGSGSGSGSQLDPNVDESFVYYTRSDFSVDAKTLLASTTGTDSVLGLKKITMDVGQNMVSKDLIGDLAVADSYSLLRAQARLLYNVGKVDASPTIEFSRDNTNWTAATVTRIGGNGNVLVGEVTFTPSANAFSSGYTGSTIATATRIASITTLAHKVQVNGFSMKLASSSTSGSLVGKIYEVISGTPTTVVATSAQTYTLGTDVTTTAQDLRFDVPSSLVLLTSKTYAFVAEATGGTISAQGVTSASGTNLSLAGSSTFSAGWSASASNVGLTVYGEAYELYLRVTSATAGSELAGFGVNYVQTLTQDINGYASYEERTITATEASTGLISLFNAKYTVGAHQLMCVHNGHTFMAPDFTELSPSQVQFAANFFQVGDLVRFYTAFGVYDGTSQALSKIGSVYSAIVGSTSQLATGVATHSSLQSAVNAVAAGSHILLLPGTYTENVTVAQECYIEGSGHGSVLSGNLTYASGSSFSTLKRLKISGNLTINSGVNGLVITDNFFTSSSVITNNGTNVSLVNIIEGAAAAVNETVACRYQMAASTALPGSTPVTLKWDTKNYDTHNAYNPATGLFTAPVPGKYSVKSGISISANALTTGQGLALKCQKNSVDYSRLGTTYGNGAGMQHRVNGADTVQLAAGETFSIYASCDAAANLSGTVFDNYFVIERIGN